MIKLTKTTDFSLRILVYLAEQKQSITNRQLASDLHIPYPHLAKLIQTLAKANMVVTQKGRGGGVRLLKNPKDISLYQVISLHDGSPQLVECLQAQSLCHLTPSCKLKRTFRTLQDMITSFFMNTTLYHIITQENS